MGRERLFDLLLILKIFLLLLLFERSYSFLQFLEQETAKYFIALRVFLYRSRKRYATFSFVNGSIGYLSIVSVRYYVSTRSFH